MTANPPGRYVCPRCHHGVTLHVMPSTPPTCYCKRGGILMHWKQLPKEQP